MVAPLPLRVRSFPPSEPTTGRPLGPLVELSTAVRLYVPPAASSIVSAAVLALTAFMTGIRPPPKTPGETDVTGDVRSPLATWKVDSAMRSSRRSVSGLRRRDTADGFLLACS